jgi:hypothetical protein
MWFLGIGAPVGFLGLLLGLAWLEDKIVLPLDRAARVERLLESTSPDQIEAAIAQMFAPIAPRREKAPSEKVAS